MTIEELRKTREELREITGRIIELLAYRLEKAEKVGELKRELGLPNVDLETERELREYVSKKSAQYGLDDAFIQQIMTLIFNESIKRQDGKEPKNKIPRITHIDIFRKAKELEVSGREIVHLEVGEPNFGAPIKVADKLSEAAKKGYAFYGDAKGHVNLREAISEYLENRFGVSLSKDEILVTPGGRFAVYLAAAATLAPGDEALIIDPSWPAYKQITEFLQCRPVVIKTSLSTGWLPNIDELEKSTSRATKILFINYPNNPTGVTISKELLKALVDFARRKKINVISDEVYMDYAFNGFTSILETNYDNAIMIMSFSKSYGMTGYRIGYLVAKKEIIDRAARIQSLLMTCVPEFIQIAAIEALADVETPRKYREEMKRRIDKVCQMLDEINAEYVKPTGGMYVFPRFRSLKMNSIELALKLLDKYGVSVAPGLSFGDYPDHIRISTGCELSKIITGMEKLREALNEQ